MSKGMRFSPSLFKPTYPSIGSLITCVLLSAWGRGQTAPQNDFPARLEDLTTRGQLESDQLVNLRRDVERKKFYEVQPALLGYVKNHPRSWEAYYLLGYSFFETKATQKSIVALQKALDLKPDYAEAHKVLGLDYVMEGRLDEAEAEMQQAVALLPQSAQIRYYMGRIYYTRGTFPLARKEFEEAIRLDPSYMKAYDNLGLTLEALGSDAEAISNYMTAIKLMQEKGVRSEWPYVNLSSLHNRRSRYDLALKNAELAVKINPLSDQAYFQMAKAYHAKGEWTKAAESLQKAIEINPNSSQYHYTLSQVYRRAGKPAESQKEMGIFMKLRSGSED